MKLDVPDSVMRDVGPSWLRSGHGGPQKVHETVAAMVRAEASGSIDVAAAPELVGALSAVEYNGDRVDDLVAVMIDRLVHNADVLTPSCDSYRTRARREILAKDRAHGD